MRLVDGIEEYLLALYRQASPVTVRQARVTLTGFARSLPDDIDIGDVTTDHIRAYRDGAQVKPQSANKYVERIRSFFRYARRHRWVAENPADDVERLQEELPHRPRVNASTLIHALDVVEEPRDRAAIALALELLLRGSEIARLQVGDLDLDNRILKVKVSKKNGDKDQEDEIALSDELLWELKSWLRHYTEAAGTLEDHHFLLPRVDRRQSGHRSVRVYRPSAPMGHPWTVVAQALRQLGVSEARLGFHTIRRSAARILFDHLVDTRGVDAALSHVSSLLHHAHRSTTESYLGVQGDRVRRNRAIRQGTASVLRATRATVDEPQVGRSSTSETCVVPLTGS